MANRIRGEVAFVLGEEHLTLRPTFAALAEMEDLCGCGLLSLARKFHAGDGSLKDISHILWAGLKGAGANPLPSVKQLGERIVAEGAVHFIPVVADFLTQALGANTVNKDN